MFICTFHLEISSFFGKSLVFLFLYSVSMSLRVIKSRKLKWAGHVAMLQDGRIVLKILSKSTEKRSL